jgi:hypothetical protein
MLTFLVLAVLALGLLIAVYDIYQQHKQKQEAERRSIIEKQKAVIDEIEELLLNANRIPFSKILVILLQTRSLNALQTLSRLNPNVISIRQRIEDTQSQIDYAREHFKGDDFMFRMPDSERQAIKILQTNRKLRNILRSEHQKGKIDLQTFLLEDNRIEIISLKVNISNLMQKAMTARMQHQMGTAKQLLTRGINALSALRNKDAELIASEEDMRTTLEDIETQIEKEMEAERALIIEKEQENIDFLFQPKKKWQLNQ